MIKLLNKKGYHVFGFDKSEAMVGLAKKKCTNPVWVGDMRLLSAKSTFDGVICLYDTIHYLRLHELPLFLREAYRMLSNEGVLIFDIITEPFVIHYWANFTEIDEGDGWQYLRRSRYNRNDQCLVTEFDITLTGYTPYHERHNQYVYPLETYSDLLRKNGFLIWGCFDELTLEEYRDDSSRIHFVAKREASFDPSR